MKTSEAAKTLIKHHEGVRNRPYLCPAKLWTVGVGHVLYPDQTKTSLTERPQYPLKPEDNKVWSPDEINALLTFDLARFERGVARLCPAAALTQNQNHFDALVSFSFNVGLGNLQNSGLRFKYNRGEYEQAAGEFLKWTKGGGKATTCAVVKAATCEVFRLLS